MKNITKTVLMLLFLPWALTSCEGLLDVDSELYVKDEEYRIASSNDSIYAMFGLFAKMQDLADSYVLLGELRGDLMTTTDKSNPDLVEIEQFDLKEDNPYNNPKAYYAVINNCNYIIRYADTTVVRKKEKVMYKVVAAAKAIRAWTYLQLALNYKTVQYSSDPILSVADAEKTYPELTLDQLADSLIADLQPYKDYDQLDFVTTIDNTDFSDGLFPLRLILGDLYLWTGRYEQAATEYRDLLFNQTMVLTTSYQSVLTTVNGVFSGAATYAWGYGFEPMSNEVVTNIAASNEYGTHFMLDSLARDLQLTNTAFALQNWESQRYMDQVNNVNIDTLCDLRMMESILCDLTVGNSGYSGMRPSSLKDNYLVKLIRMNFPVYKSKRVMPYRRATVYLRYAEAVNRTGRPNLALAVLKNGLNRVTLANRSLVPKSEVPDTLGADQRFLDFKNTRFDYNIGVRARGLKRSDLDSRFVIPSALDSLGRVEYVEDLILNECALETAFEGNRFHDLMRVALRRNQPEYLAVKVAAKYGANRATMEAQLKNTDLWYLH